MTKKYSEERINQIIADASARNMFAPNETDEEKRRLAIEFLRDIGETEDNENN